MDTSLSDSGATEPESVAPANERPRSAPRVAASRVRAFLDRCSAPAFFAAVVAPLLLVYLLTTSWAEPLSPDTYLNQLTAYNIAKKHTVYLDDRANDRRVPAGQWILETPDGRLISTYSPGVAFHAAPLYLLAGKPVRTTVLPPPRWAHARGLAVEPVVLDLVPTWPAALTAVILTTVAMGFLGLTLRLLGAGSAAAAGTWVAGLATSAWSVGADELWQHSATMMWIAIGGYAIARSRGATSALATTVSILVRPLTVLVGLGPTLLAMRQRRWRAMVPGLVAAAAGLGLILWYNKSIYGVASLGGGYGTSRTQALQNRFPWWIIANFGSGLFSPRYGLLVWSPFLILLLGGIRPAWRAAPDWVRGPALGGALYLGAHWSLEIASGGAAYYFYRYPLETLVASGPLLFLAYRHRVQPSERRRRWFWMLVVVAGAAHAVVSLG